MCICVYSGVSVVKEFCGGKLLLHHFGSKHRVQGVLAVHAGGVGHFLIESEEVKEEGRAGLQWRGGIPRRGRARVVHHALHTKCKSYYYDTQLLTDNPESRIRKQEVEQLEQKDGGEVIVLRDSKLTGLDV